jgi:hypothetical protein
MSDRAAPRWARWAPLAVALLAIGSSITGIVNGFTYDDHYIVELNKVVHDLTRWYHAFAESYWPADWGGDGYRPLTILMFKIEWALGRGSPMPFHATNILLYACVSALVWVVARRLLPAWAALLVAALFAVHPVHVEAVANVVGQSELWVAICFLSAIALYLRDRMRGPLRAWTAVAVIALYLSGCLFKEHAIVLPAVLGIAELTILDGGRSLRSLLHDRRARIFYLSIAGVAIVFIAARAAILSDHGIGGFQPFTPFSSLRITRFQRTLTAVGVVPEWIRLFYGPARLSSEYGPPDIQIAQGVALWQLPGFLLLAGILAIGVLLRRREPVLSLAIGFVCAALLPSSNFLVPAGIVLAERTLFLQSVGAMLLVGGLQAIVARRRPSERSFTARERALAVAAVAIVVAAGMARSLVRTTVWKNNDTLFAHAVIDSPLSYRAHYMFGAWLFDKGQKSRGEAEYRRALSLFPYDAALSYNMAEQYRQVGMCGPALPLYRWTRDLSPDFPFGRAAHAQCLLEVGQYAEAKAMALSAISAGGSVKLARRLIFLADSAKAADAVSRRAAAVRLAGSPSKVP